MSDVEEEFEKSNPKHYTSTVLAIHLILRLQNHDLFQKLGLIELKVQLFGLNIPLNEKLSRTARELNRVAGAVTTATPSPHNYRTEYISIK